MAMKIAASARTVVMNALADLLDAGGTIEIRTGAQPATADDAATGTLLCTFTLPAPAFDAAGTTSVAIDADPDLSAVAAATGTAGWARVKNNSAATVFDGEVGTSGATFTINTTSITSGQTVLLTSGQINYPA